MKHYIHLLWSLGDSSHPWLLHIKVTWAFPKSADVWASPHTNCVHIFGYFLRSFPGDSDVQWGWRNTGLGINSRIFVSLPMACFKQEVSMQAQLPEMEFMVHEEQQFTSHLTMNSLLGSRSSYCKMEVITHPHFYFRKLWESNEKSKFLVHVLQKLGTIIIISIIKHSWP